MITLLSGRRIAVATSAPRGRVLSATALPALLVLAASLASVTANGGPREQARGIHERLAGVPPTEAVLADMQADVAASNATDAAYTAMDNSSFYSVTLKNFAAPWTNRD